MSRFDGIAGSVTTRLKFVKRFLGIFGSRPERSDGEIGRPVIYEYMIFFLKHKRKKK